MYKVQPEKKWDETVIISITLINHSFYDMANQRLWQANDQPYSLIMNENEM